MEKSQEMLSLLCNNLEQLKKIVNKVLILKFNEMYFNERYNKE